MPPVSILTPYASTTITGSVSTPTGAATWNVGGNTTYTTGSVLTFSDGTKVYLVDGSTSGSSGSLGSAVTAANASSGSQVIIIASSATCSLPQVAITQSGITIMGASSTNLPTLKYSSGYNWLLKITAGNTTVKNLIVDNTGGGSYAMMASGTASSAGLSGLTITNVQFTNAFMNNGSNADSGNTRGVSIDTFRNVTITGTIFPKTARYGLSLGSVQNLTVTGSTFYTCASGAIGIFPTTTTFTPAISSAVLGCSGIDLSDPANTFVNGSTAISGTAQYPFILVQPYSMAYLPGCALAADIAASTGKVAAPDILCTGPNPNVKAPPNFYAYVNDVDENSAAIANINQASVAAVSTYLSYDVMNFFGTTLSPVRLNSSFSPNPFTGYSQLVTLTSNATLLKNYLMSVGQSSATATAVANAVCTPVAAHPFPSNIYYYGVNLTNGNYIIENIPDSFSMTQFMSTIAPSASSVVEVEVLSQLPGSFTCVFYVDAKTQYYKYVNGSLKSAGTILELSPAPTSGGGVGDPYIRTIQGDIYKLPAFNGFVRLYQGLVNGTLFTVNAQTTIDDNSVAMDRDTLAINSTFTTPVDTASLIMKTPMSFFERLYIQYGTESMVVNILNGFTVERSSTWSVKNTGNVREYLQNFPMYKHLSGEIFDISPCSDVVVRVGIVPIRSIRNSVEIVAPNMELGNGAYVHKLSKKCVQVKKLTSVAAVSTKENAVRRMLEEVFQCEKETYTAQIAYVG